MRGIRTRPTALLHSFSTDDASRNRYLAVQLESILQYLEGYLGVRDHPDYPTAVNGLQVGIDREVSRIATAVDASEASIRAAAALGADLLLVHHGLFWEGLRPMTGRRYRRIAALVENGIALYSCHLPLDAHAEVGNCALLGRALGLELAGRFGTYKGADIGWWGRLREPTDAAGLAARLEEVLNGPVQARPGGPERIELVGVVTGGGGSFIADAATLGLDAFVTGEGSHHNYFDAAEHGIHVLLGGHYATETFGVRALGAHLAERFGLEATFIDQPTGL
jgi:dinuclear metal center YbgI/SA1388 family protein